MFIRKNVWGLVGGAWPDELLWYARGVKEMQSRPLATPTSWRFYAGIHGFNQVLWQQLGYFAPGDRLPSATLVKRFWDQCQHGSWYFLPWHRGFVKALEDNVRAAIVQAGGPADWALPYWNYFKKGQAKLPPAFATPHWPDGADNNPLFVAPRYGPHGDGKVVVPVGQINLDALNDPDFTGVAIGGSPGFGGVDTGYAHNGNVHGGLETQPHDWVHGLVGGARNNDRQFPGAMSVPSSAGLDPIFWLHHANIDRLWASWLRPPTTHADPTDRTWIRGPASIGEHKFQLPTPDGTTWTYTPADVIDTTVLGYEYDDLSPTGARRRASRTPQPMAVTVTAAEGGAAAVSDQHDVEMMGASQPSVTVSGTDVHATVQMDTDMRGKVAARFTDSARAAAPSAPDRVFLNLENVRGKNDATSFSVYVGVPAGEPVANYSNRLAGSTALFGVRAASEPDGEHGGQGLTYVFDITRIVQELHADSSLDVEQLPVRIVPTNPVSDDEQLSIGRISIFRQGR
jgi:tyrosinase